MPMCVRIPLDHFASETDPSGLATPPTITPLLFKASPPVLENGMKGSGVKPYRSPVKLEFMVNPIRQALVRGCAVQQELPQAALAIHEYPRQPQTVVRRARHSPLDCHRRGVARVPHKLDGVGCKAAVGVGEMLDRDAQHIAQCSPLSAISYRASSCGNSCSRRC